jgi:hypothetical protein
LELDRILTGSALALITTSSFNVNVPISGARFDGDGSGLFNIPPDALENLELDRIVTGSALAVISEPRGLEVNVPTTITGSLTVSGGLFLTGSNLVVGSGSIIIGDGSGLTNITIANLSFETEVLNSGSAECVCFSTVGFHRFCINYQTNIFKYMYLI